MNIKVCVGSSCHLKGSYDVIQTLKDVIKKYDVEDLIELQASFCLGYCAQGVTVQSDGYSSHLENRDGYLLLHNVDKNNVEELFAQKIYPLLNLQ